MSTARVGERSAGAIIVDDDDDMRFLVRVIIEREPGLNVVAEVTDGAAARS